MEKEETSTSWEHSKQQKGRNKFAVTLHRRNCRNYSWRYLRYRERDRQRERMEVEISLDRFRNARCIVFTFYRIQTWWKILWLLQPVAVSLFKKRIDGPFLLVAAHWRESVLWTPFINTWIAGYYLNLPRSYPLINPLSVSATAGAK